MSYESIFKNKTVLITGGTGFLGTHLIREILKFNPHSIRVFSRDEVKHHKVQELFNYDERLRNLIGDVRSYDRLKKAMRGVDIVIHGAALKRVDILEYNVEEAIKTNILGTMNVVNACLENNVKISVFISSDKGCSPVNTYGACKFIGERIFTESNYSKGSAPTIFTCVRYGNVLESTGSVIPFFESKIKAGEKIPLTNPRMTRFIISPKESVELIFNAISYSVGGEVFVPKLPSFKIIDLIEVLKEKHKANNEIKVIGTRPGEKIHELMINESEIPRTFEFKNLFVVTSPIEKYQNVKKGEYCKKGKPVNTRKMKNYSSKDVLISKDGVYKIFRSLKLV
ncbi:hypothetical protein AYK26_02115 [Euryarchaeota archaeon SM23-78]|nr:MAG: hypothetical protein AYK26_02115 [Euryarchaeota archaeon SM23-78]MBW3000357.1 SDR family NAD(P)-dependent oxidoreductase [Candidatus Woesearchaeota archaeon]